MHDFLMGLQSKSLGYLVFGIVYLFFLLFCDTMCRRSLDEAEKNENKKMDR